MTSNDSRSAKPGRKRSENRKMVTEQVNLILRPDTGVLKANSPGLPKEDPNTKTKIKNPPSGAIECVTLNASDSGVSIYCEKPLKTGARFVVYSGKIWDTPKNGTVKWCRKIAPGLYRAGILFVQNGDESTEVPACPDGEELFFEEPAEPGK